MALCTVEYSTVCACHNQDVPDIQEFEVAGRFDHDKPVVETVAPAIQLDRVASV
jgi:hypothetical protein